MNDSYEKRMAKLEINQDIFISDLTKIANAQNEILEHLQLLQDKIEHLETRILDRLEWVEIVNGEGLPLKSKRKDFDQKIYDFMRLKPIKLYINKILAFAISLLAIANLIVQIFIRRK